MGGFLVPVKGVLGWRARVIPVALFCYHDRGVCVRRHRQRECMCSFFLWKLGRKLAAACSIMYRRRRFDGHGKCVGVCIL